MTGTTAAVADPHLRRGHPGNVRAQPRGEPVLRVRLPGSDSLISIGANQIKAAHRLPHPRAQGRRRRTSARRVQASRRRTGCACCTAAGSGYPATAACSTTPHRPTVRRAQRRCGTGQRFKPGQRQWSVKPGTRVTISARIYTVTQVCSYRVVQEPKDPKDRTALAAAPKSCDTDGGSVDEGLRLTTNHTVLAAAAKASPAEGQTLAPLNNGGVQRFEPFRVR